MPPKKRKAAGAAAKSSTQPAKKARTGDKAIIDDESRASTPSGRPKRSTSNEEPQYNFARRKNTTATQNGDKSTQGSTAALTPEATSEVPKRGRGRPAKVSPPEVEESAPAVTKRGRGRPPKVSFNPTGDPAPATPNKKGILKNGTGAGNKLSTTRPNIRASGGSTASAAKKRSSATASPPAKKRIGRPAKKKRGRPSTKTESTDGAGHTIVSLAPEVNGSHNDDGAIDEDVQYWLMKAEPESRIEKGHDVKFSIDDLAARTEPEGWDGVRSPAARNIMRAMRVGDLAFFYHSNCKIPGVAGVMRIVEEHSVDESAFDPDHPYYDPKSSRDSPKWELVKVEFVKKFDELVTLRELKSFAAEGGALAGMQMLRQGRLSVSSVQPAEWRFILDLAQEPRTLGHPVKADGYESDTDGETEGQLDGDVKTDGESGAEPGSSFDYPADGDVEPGTTLNGYSPVTVQADDTEVQVGDYESSEEAGGIAV